MKGSALILIVGVVAAGALTGEFVRKYPEGATISKVPSSVHPTSGVDFGGRQLEGTMILEVPEQRRPVPQSILDYAKENDIIIRDPTGRMY